MNLSRTPCALAWRGATALAFPLAAFAQAPSADAPAQIPGRGHRQQRPADLLAHADPDHH